MAVRENKKNKNYITRIRKNKPVKSKGVNL
jgi:hypothetical protein